MGLAFFTWSDTFLIISNLVINQLILLHIEKIIFFASISYLQSIDRKRALRLQHLRLYIFSCSKVSKVLVAPKKRKCRDVLEHTCISNIQISHVFNTKDIVS